MIAIAFAPLAIATARTAFSLLMSCGQILFKKTALSLAGERDPNIVYGVVEGFIRALSNPWLYLALIVYASATLFWLYILQRIPLPQAYPFTALAMVIVPIFSVIIFINSYPSFPKSLNISSTS